MNRSNEPYPPQMTDDELAMLDMYLNPAISLQEIAIKFNFSMPSLLDLLERPDIVALVQRLTAMNARRARDISLMALPTNVARLQHIGETSPNQELARKSLSAVVRVALQREAPGRSAGKRERAVPEPDRQITSAEPDRDQQDAGDANAPRDIRASDNIHVSKLDDALAGFPSTHHATRSPRGPRTPARHGQPADPTDASMLTASGAASSA